MRLIANRFYKKWERTYKRGSYTPAWMQRIVYITDDILQECINRKGTQLNPYLNYSSKALKKALLK